MRPLSDADYQRLLRFRTGLRRFLRWSEEHAEAVGITPGQHQLLLAVRGHPDQRGPTIGDVASYLLLRHHSVVELVDRAVDLVRRLPDPDDRRVVRLALTERGADLLSRLTEANLDELTRLAPEYDALWQGLQPTKHLPPTQRSDPEVSDPAAAEG